MAVVSTADLEAQKRQNEPTSTGASGAQPITMGGGGSSAGPISQKPSSSGRFTNLQSYLNTNKSGPGMAGQLKSDFEKRNEEYQSQLQKSGQQLQGATQQFGQEKQQAGQQAAEQIKQDPTKMDVNQFAQLRDVQYNGPQALQDQYKLQSQAQQLGQMGQLTGNEAGRAQLLRQTFQKPTYTQGQVGLDQALLQTNPQQLAKVKALQSIGQQATRGLNTAQQQAAENVQGAQAAAQNVRGQVRGSLETAAQGTQTALEQQAAQANATRQAEFEAEQNNLGNLNLSDTDLQALGLQRGQQIWGLSGDQLKQYLNQGQQATTQNVASAQDIAKINALKNLAGNTASEQASKIYNQQYGGLDTNAYNFSQEAPQKLQQYMTLQQQGYQRESQPLAEAISREAQPRLAELQSQREQMQNTPEYDENGFYTPHNFADIDNQIAQENQKIAANQAALQAIQQKYGVGRTLGGYTPTASQTASKDYSSTTRG